MSAPRAVKADGLSSDLLRDPRHLRGDLRLLWSAVRRGEVPDERKAPLVARLGEVQDELELPGGFPTLSAGTKARILFLVGNVLIAMTRANLAIDNARMSIEERALRLRRIGNTGSGRRRPTIPVK